MIDSTLVHVRGKKTGEVKGEYGKVLEEEKGNADNGVIFSIQSATCCTCMKGVEWGLYTRDLRLVAVFWVGIPVSSS